MHAKAVILLWFQFLSYLAKVSSGVRIFLTGGTGLIGLALVKALRRRDWAVTALVRNPTSKAAHAIQALGAQLVTGDVCDRTTLRQPMLGADVVIHNAGWVGVGLSAAEQRQQRAINVTGTANTLGLAVELQIPKILYTSSITAFGPTGDYAMADEHYTRRHRPSTHYDVTKEAAHAIAVRLQQKGAPLIIICPGNVVGPNDRSPLGYMMRLYVRGWLPPIMWARNRKISLIHADDLAETSTLAVEKGRIGETYIAVDAVATMYEIFHSWDSTLGGIKPFCWVNPFTANMIGRLAAPCLRGLGLPAFISKEVVAYTHAGWAFSGEKAKRELGAPTRGLHKMWQDTLAIEYASAQTRRWSITPDESN